MRILVADDHETVRKGVCSILQSHKNLEVCGEASDGREAVQQAFELNLDLIVLDVTMPVLDGLAAARQIRRVLTKVPILILSMHDSASMVKEAQRAGAQGFVSKADAGKVLLEAIYALLQGQTFFPTQS